MSPYPGRYRPPSHRYLILAGDDTKTRPWQRAEHNELDPSVPVPITETAVIGTELRIPVTTCELCELGPCSCISRHADPDAGGFADIRARAIRAGWREDALGRLACPQCQQDGTVYRPKYSAELWDWQLALAQMKDIAGDRTDGAAAETEAMPAVTAVIQIPAAQPPAPAARTGRGRHRMQKRTT